MNKTNTIVSFFTQTSLHAGTGKNTASVIDLPIQREAHSDWPCVYGSAVKGALRAKFKEQDKQLTCRLFGSEHTGEEGNAGCLAISDARLLLLPVRSLTSHFKWVTCPAALARWKTDCLRLGLDLASSLKLPEPKEEQALLPLNSIERVLYLEEYRLEPETTADLDDWVKALAAMMPTAKEAELKKQLVVVSNNLFAFFSKYATPVQAHNRLESETKTVKNGALWYEESLPPETLLYTSVTAFNSRNNQTIEAAENLNNFNEILEQSPWIQIGGNETVGMGFCHSKCL